MKINTHLILIQIKKNKSFVLTVIVLVGLYFLTQLIPADKIHLILSRAGVFAPLVFVFLVFLTHLIPPISSAPLAFAGFYFFGQQVVFLITIAIFISYITNFLIARIWGRSLVSKIVGVGSMNQIDKLTKNYGLITLLILRIFMGGVHDFISYAAGLTTFKFLPYIIISSCTLVMQTLLWYYLALKIQSPLEFTVLNFTLGLIFTGLFIVGSLIFKRWKKR